jgi:hypothetical protein
MYFPVALICVAIPFLAQASLSEATSKTGLSIPISKRSTFHNADGVVDTTKLGASQHHTIAFVSIILFTEHAGSVQRPALGKSNVDWMLSRELLVERTPSHQK